MLFSSNKSKMSEEKRKNQKNSLSFEVDKRKSSAYSNTEHEHRKFSITEDEDPFQHVDEIGKSLKTLNTMAKRPAVDIEFKNIVYTVKQKKKAGLPPILDGLSGHFKSGQLTAILGPSGAGKSTLLNILTGYICPEIKGEILVNNEPRNMALYHKLSCYIMQDDLLQPYLTVDEAMSISADLKLGKELKKEDKKLVVDEVLNTLGLTACRNTRSEYLSGGQKKRLAVALELVSNPPIIFLDEPTTGLDVVAIKQCISLLKILANNGRTVICTIHQPTFPILTLFNNVYILAKGKCVYTGDPKQLVPFMDSSNYICPKTHNPSDFIMETLQSDPKGIDVMVNKIDNGRCKNWIQKQSSNTAKVTECFGANNNTEEQEVKIENLSANFSSSFWTQFSVLLKRMIVQKLRCRVALWIQLIHHVVCSLFVGGVFFNIGSDGSQSFSNFKLCLVMMLLISYTYAMIPILVYPLELERLKREHFNRWYSLNSYFTALSISNIPFMVTLVTLAVVLIYFMTGQALEFNRFLLFTLMAFITGICAEAFGLAIASIFNSQNGAIMGPGIVIPLTVVSLYGLGFGTKIETIMTVIMRISFVRFSIVGFAVPLFKDRGTLDCPDLYCHYANMETFMKEMGMGDATYLFEAAGLVGFTILYKMAAYFVIYHKLKADSIFKLLNIKL